MSEENLPEKGRKRGSDEGGGSQRYGLQTYTPEQEKEQWRESIRREFKISKNHTINSGSAELCKAWKVSPSRYLAGDQSLHSISYFNTGKKSTASSTYDRTFHIKEGYCSKLRRDDRQHTIGLDVFAEECKKDVPTLTSSLYGRRPALEIPARKHCRVATVKRDFYRESGANITGQLSIIK